MTALRVFDVLLLLLIYSAFSCAQVHFRVSPGTAYSSITTGYNACLAANTSCVLSVAPAVYNENLNINLISGHSISIVGDSPESGSPVVSLVCNDRTIPAITIGANQDVRLSGLKISGCGTTTSLGAAVVVSGGSALEIRDSECVYNTARRGACIYSANDGMTGGRITVENSMITNNNATESGGGIYIAKSSFTISISKSTFKNNTVPLEGGAIYITENRALLYIHNGTLFESNEGCAVAIYYSIGVIMNTNFKSNFIIATEENREIVQEQDEVARGIPGALLAIGSIVNVYSCDFIGSAGIGVSAAILFRRSSSEFEDVIVEKSSSTVVISNQFYSAAVFDNADEHRISNTTLLIELRFTRVLIMDTENGAGLAFFLKYDPQNNDITIDIDDCGFSDNKRGAIFVDGTAENIRIHDTVLVRNNAQLLGAGFYFRTAPTATKARIHIHKCQISENLSNVLGAGFAATIFDLVDEDLFPEPSEIIIEDCLFDRNTASSGGGGIYLDTARYRVTLLNSQLVDNIIASTTTSISRGGGLAITLSAERLRHPTLGASFTISGCTFHSNRATLGGAIYLANVPETYPIVVKGSTVLDMNTALRSGGGLFAQQVENLSVNDCVIKRNHVLYMPIETMRASTAPGGFGMFIDYGSKATIRNITFTDNFVAKPVTDDFVRLNLILRGAGILVTDGSSLNATNVSLISNDVTTAQGGGVAVTDRAVVRFEDCIVKDNKADVGAGIYASSNAMLVLSSSTLKGNTALSTGGAIYLTTQARMEGYRLTLTDNVASAPVTEPSNNMYCSGANVSFAETAEATTPTGGYGVACNVDDACYAFGDIIIAANNSCMLQPTPKPSPTPSQSPDPSPSPEPDEGLTEAAFLAIIVASVVIAALFLITAIVLVVRLVQRKRLERLQKEHLVVLMEEYEYR